MKLSPQQVERFYSIWMPLIRFVNQRRNLVPQAALQEPWDPNEVAKVRDVLWEDDSLREQFIAENPAGLSAADLAVVAGWQHRRAGPFYVLRSLKSYSIVISEKESAVYGVLGLASPLEEVVPFVPCYVRMVLLPFEDVITYDSLLTYYNIHFGKGIRGGLEQKYKDAKERGAIITSLLLSEAPVAGPAAEEAAQSTNAKVLQAFRTHLFRSGLSEKVVGRDVANVTSFAEDYLLRLPEPLSLRDISGEQFKGYLSKLPGRFPTETQRRQVVTSLKRLVRFLRDTERMEYWTAEDAKDILNNQP